MELNSFSPDEIEDVIIRFLRHQTSPEEIRLLEEWLGQDVANREQFDKINTTFQALRDDQPQYQSEDAAWESVAGKLENPVRIQRVKHLHPFRHSLVKIAATVLLLVVASFAFWRYTMEDKPFIADSITIHAAPEKRKIILPDQTTVWLNANSSLTYGERFNHDNRNVTLQGEAYFDVAKTGVDFIVTTNNLVIQVKGTRFNVKATPGDKEYATLEEGKVLLKVSGYNESFDMKPGDQLVFNKESKELVLQVVNAPSYSVWKEEQLVFNDVSLSEISLKLEKRFNVNITMDETSASQDLSMIVRDETLEEVLELIRISSSLRYSIQGNEVTLSTDPGIKNP